MGKEKGGGGKRKTVKREKFWEMGGGEGETAWRRRLLVLSTGGGKA